MSRRKSPIRHKVRTHKRLGKTIKSFTRGSGIRNKKSRVVKSEKIEVPIPGLEVTLDTIEHPQFKTRKKIIFCIAEFKAVQLGTLITTLHVKPRKSDWEPIKYVPLYYRVELTNADVSESEGEYDFDDKEKAMDFIEKLRYKGAREIIVDTKADFDRWKKGMDIFRESEKG